MKTYEAWILLLIILLLGILIGGMAGYALGLNHAYFIIADAKSTNYVDCYQVIANATGNSLTPINCTMIP
jgi:membrane protein YqaA with SNARE-associated domain